MNRNRNSCPGRRASGAFLRLRQVFCLLGLIVAVGCGEAEESAHGGESEAVPVIVSRVHPETVTRTVQGIGTLRAERDVQIRPETSGILREVAFEEASMVEEGDLLFRLDAVKAEREIEVSQAEVNAARARLENARESFDRLERLYEERVISEDEFDNARAELRSAQAAYDEVEARLGLTEERRGDTLIRAPFDGIISASHVDPGDYVSVGDQLATLYGTQEMEISFQLPERYIGQVETGQPIEVLLAAFPEEEFEGQVDFVSPAVDEATRSFEVKATIDNERGLLRPGLFATADVTIEQREGVPVVPEESLIGTRRGFIVFVVEDDVAHQRDVEVGLREPGQAEILQGVEVGELVVARGHLRLQDGSKVRVLETQNAPTVVETEGEPRPLSQNEDAEAGEARAEGISPDAAAPGAQSAEQSSRAEDHANRMPVRHRLASVSARSEIPAPQWSRATGATVAQ